MNGSVYYLWLLLVATTVTWSDTPACAGVFIKGGMGNEEMGNGEIRKRRNGLEMVVKSILQC